MLVMLGVALAPSALADSVQNIIAKVEGSASNNGNLYITTTTAGSVGFYVQAENNDGERGCNARSESPATVTINADAAVRREPASLTFTACGKQNGENAQFVTFSSATPGVYPITFSVSDSGNGAYDAAGAEFLLHVDSPAQGGNSPQDDSPAHGGTPAPPADTTAPTITLVSRTPANENGWNNGPVSIAWSCEDTESGVVESTVSALLTEEGAAQSASGTCTDGAGNTASDTQTGINIDLTAPTIEFAARTEPNAAGWNNEPVTVSWNCADELSGPASEIVEQTVGTEGVGQETTGQCFDRAGNSASDTQSGINIDLTAPTITCSDSIATATSTSGASFVPSCTATDNFDAAPQVVCSPTAATTLSPGKHVVSCHAVDAADNAGSSADSQVWVQYSFCGFKPPIGPKSTFKLGSTIPVKFCLSGESQGIADLKATISVTKVSNDVPGSPQGGTSNKPDSGVYFRYSSSDDQYIYNLATKPLSKGTWRVSTDLGDGVTHTVDIGLA